MTSSPILSPILFTKIYPVSIKDANQQRWTVGTTRNTREELFQNIVRMKRNLKTAFSV